MNNYGHLISATSHNSFPFINRMSNKEQLFPFIGLVQKVSIDEWKNIWSLKYYFYFATLFLYILWNRYNYRKFFSKLDWKQLIWKCWQIFYRFAFPIDTCLVLSFIISKITVAFEILLNSRICVKYNSAHIESYKSEYFVNKYFGSFISAVLIRFRYYQKRKYLASLFVFSVNILVLFY